MLWSQYIPVCISHTHIINLSLHKHTDREMELNLFGLWVFFSSGKQYLGHEKIQNRNRPWRVNDVGENPPFHSEHALHLRVHNVEIPSHVLLKSEFNIRWVVNESNECGNRVWEIQNGCDHQNWHSFITDSEYKLPCVTHKLSLKNNQTLLILYLKSLTTEASSTMAFSAKPTSTHSDCILNNYRNFILNTCRL